MEKLSLLKRWEKLRILLFQQSLNVIVKTTVITLNVIIKIMANDTPSQGHFLNVALSDILLSGGECKKCSWVGFFL